jgi:hypothetical protein
MLKETQTLGKMGNHNGPDVGYGTHLTIHSGCSIQAQYAENYGQEGGQARNGVNL